MFKIDETLHEVLGNVIGKLGISKETIAKEVGVSPMTVYRWKTKQSFPKSKAVVGSLLNYLQRVQNG